MLSQSGKWCKGKYLFWNHQIFSEDFFRNFSEPFSLRPRPSVLSEAGAKVSQISESPKISGLFLKHFSEPRLHSVKAQNRSHPRTLPRKKLHEYEPFCLPQEACFSLEAGAKIRLTKCYFQIFQRLFLTFFCAFLHPTISQQVSYEKFLLYLQHAGQQQEDGYSGTATRRPTGAARRLTDST